jgi:CRP/FNR family transcriptional regulator
MTVDNDTSIDLNCLTCHRKSPLFCLLSNEELALVKNTKLTVKFRKGETIKKQGTYMSHVVSINGGLVKTYLEGLENRNTILRIVRPTNFIGGPGLYLDQMHHFTVTALMDSSVCFIDIKIFKQLIEQNKKFAEEFLKDFSRNILSVYNRLVNLTQKQMHGRMADTLLYLFDEIFENSTFEMLLTKQDLADLSGMSKDRAIKLLRAFQDEWIIRWVGNELALIDREALKKISRIG